MKGKNVLRKAGWDTHGLPVELEVEKLLGLDGKEQIEKYGIEPFIKKCKESVWKYKGMWEEMSERVGFWADMEHPYITYEDNYIESEWWSLKKIVEKGLLYKGHKVVPYCPRCGTALSSHEVIAGLQERDGALRHRPLQGQGRGKHLPLRLDDHALDAAQQRRAVRQRPTKPTPASTAKAAPSSWRDALIHTVLGDERDRPTRPPSPASDLVGMRYEPLFDFQKELRQGRRNAKTPGRSSPTTTSP